jgi:uncharacterized protein (TIGR02246 family)
MINDPSDTPMREVLDRWKAAFDGHRTDAMAGLFTPDALFQGFGPETLAGREAVRDYYEAVPAHRAARVGTVQGYRIGEDVAGGFADVTFHDPDGWEAPVHLSLVLLREDGAWRIRQYHVSRVSAEH